MSRLQIWSRSFSPRKSWIDRLPSLRGAPRSTLAFPSCPYKEYALKTLTRSLLIAASLLVSPDISTTAHAQGQTPAVSGTTTTQSPSRAQQLMGAMAPKLAELTDDVLYRDV